MNERLPSPQVGDNLEPSDLPTGLCEQIRPALLSLLVLTLLTGIAFPLAVAALAVPLFSHQAEGGLLTRDGVVVGAELIGQSFSSLEYFHPRPSAAGEGYDAMASGGTNLGPANPKLRDGVPGDAASAGNSKPFAGVRELAEAYRRTNGLPPHAVVPIDAVTRSGSGLDPHISPANAALQIPRVARQRQLSEETVQRLVAEHTQGRQLGFLGEPRVAVLSLNLALDQLAPRLPPRSR
jgi:K+-transporting ATPase ATPase C chain